MARLFVYAIWLIQLACLVTILWCSWLLLDREVFALVAASVVLAVTLYLERVMDVDIIGDV